MRKSFEIFKHFPFLLCKQSKVNKGYELYDWIGQKKNPPIWEEGTQAHPHFTCSPVHPPVLLQDGLGHSWLRSSLALPEPEWGQGFSCSDFLPANCILQGTATLSQYIPTGAVPDPIQPWLWFWPGYSVTVQTRAVSNKAWNPVHTAQWFVKEWQELTIIIHLVEKRELGAHESIASQ